MVVWDGQQSVDIHVPEVYKTNHRTLGLCGVYDDDVSNDFTNVENVVENGKNVKRFANSWNSDLGCASDSTCPASCSGALLEQAEQNCSVLEADVFKACHSVVDPSPYKQLCMADVCACSANRRENCLCDILSRYAKICTANNVALRWRSPLFCRKQFFFTIHNLILLNLPFLSFIRRLY